MLFTEKQTLARAYAAQIASSETVDRTALGDFINDFFKYYADQRQSLLDDPIQMPETPTEDQRGWAAFYAASAQYLAERYSLACPSWAFDPAYVLKSPWYHPAVRVYPNLRGHFEQHAPAAFRQRNVFCSDRVFTNPYPSSREPGALTDLNQRRLRILEALPEDEREAYLRERKELMTGRPRVHIVA